MPPSLLNDRGRLHRAVEEARTLPVCGGRQLRDFSDAATPR